MRSWKREHRFNSALAIKISMLIFGFMVVGAMLIYENYSYTR
jgi:hypothetical protein